MTSELQELRAAYDAGITAAKRGQGPNTQPYGKAVPGFATKKITAWFFGYMDGRTAIWRCGTADRTQGGL
jgi:hypothetical protein